MIWDESPLLKLITWLTPYDLLTLDCSTRDFSWGFTKFPFKWFQPLKQQEKAPDAGVSSQNTNIDLGNNIMLAGNLKLMKANAFITHYFLPFFHVFFLASFLWFATTWKVSSVDSTLPMLNMENIQPLLYKSYNLQASPMLSHPNLGKILVSFWWW